MLQQVYIMHESVFAPLSGEMKKMDKSTIHALT
jgi:hypothetical protein